MPAPVRITEADLRGAMREPRYWQNGHPERNAFARWVTGGWQALNPRDGEARSAVWVRPYIRDGHPVAGHWRSPPPRHSPRPDEETGRAEAGADPVVPANLWRWLRRFAPADGRGGGPSRRDIFRRDRTRRWPDAAGRDRADDLRRDPGTRPAGTLRDNVDQWERSGGLAQRQRDLERLGPVGDPVPAKGGGLQYQLSDGRIATIRNSTSEGKHPTLEIGEPSRLPGRYIPTDKFRYPVPD